MTMAVTECHYICPRHKCRHVWSRDNYRAEPSDCPKCGAKNIDPVDCEGRAV